MKTKILLFLLAIIFTSINLFSQVTQEWVRRYNGNGTTSSYSQQGWFQQYSGTNRYLNSVIFFDQNTGWVVGGDDFGGIILKTTDGGSNWFNKYNVNNYHLVSGCFVNQNTLWAVGGDPLSYTGIIIKSTNGGNNWITLRIVDHVLLNSVFFINQNIGWVVTASSFIDTGKIFKTTNGGTNWFNQIYGDTVHLRSVFFVDQNTGWAVGDEIVPASPGLIIKTTNGGVNWFAQFHFVSILYSCFFVNRDTGWVVGIQGFITKTTNGGDNWFNQFNTMGYTNLSVFFKNQNVGWVVGDSGSTRNSSILKTTNGGINWLRQNCSTNGILWSVCFADQNTGWAVGDNGLILKTTTGGEPIGIISISNEIPKTYSLYQNYPNPFNPSTKIRFEIPSVGAFRNMLLRLVIYDVLGREVAKLVNEQLKAGMYEVEWDGSNYPSGVYFYRLVATGGEGDFVETKKMVLIK
jgi:photosystem II stability/assembly factor-like uncharacterized protein